MRADGEPVLVVTSPITLLLANIGLGLLVLALLISVVALRQRWFGTEYIALAEAPVDDPFVTAAEKRGAHIPYR